MRSGPIVILILAASAAAAAQLYPIAPVVIAPGDVLSLDWSTNGAFLAAGRDNALGSDLQILSFSNGALAEASAVDLLAGANSVRWHPTEPWVAVGCETTAFGGELRVYRAAPGSGALSLTNVLELGRSVSAVAWHPSGNYLAAGFRSGASNEVAVYSVVATGLVPFVTIDRPALRRVARNALDWDPSGSNLAFGLEFETVASDLYVYNFNAAATSSVATGTALFASAYLTALDWAPTGSLIAVGLTNYTFDMNLHVYRFVPGAATTLTLTATMHEPRGVRAVHWGHGTNTLTAGTDQGVPDLSVYRFTTNLAAAAQAYVSANVRSVRWSPDGNVLAAGTAGGSQPWIQLFTTNEGDCALTKTADPEPLEEDSNLVYRLVVTNLGPKGVYRVTVRDRLPAATTYQSALSSQGACSYGGGVVTCSLGYVAAGASAWATVRVAVAGSGVGQTHRPRACPESPA